MQNTANKVLIAGGFGYLGSRIAKSVQQSGLDLLVGSRNPQNYPNIFPTTSVLKLDWWNQDELKKICSGVDIVINASGLDAKNCVDSPTEALRVNGLATQNLAKAAVESGVKLYIYLSTAHVYRSPLQGDISETSALDNKHPYATSHLLGERLSFLANDNRHSSSKVLVIRLSNAFGAPVFNESNCWNLFANDLARQAMACGKMTIHSSKGTLRNFIPIGELCEIVSYFISLYQSLGKNEVFNVGGLSSMSLIQLAELIQDRCMNLYQFKPHIVSSCDVDQEEAVFLNYEVDKLTSFGFRFGYSYQREIDDLLEYSRVYFG